MAIEYCSPQKINKESLYSQTPMNKYLIIIKTSKSMAISVNPLYNLRPNRKIHT